jgi:hypothetical protein
MFAGLSTLAAGLFLGQSDRTPLEALEIPTRLDALYTKLDTRSRDMALTPP